MKVGDLVHVNDCEGFTFGRGILLELDDEVNRVMSYHYSRVWMFDFERAPIMTEKIMTLRTDFIKPIKSAEDW